MKKYLINKKYQWIRLCLVAALIAAVFGFSIYTSGISMPYFAVNLGLVMLILAGLLLDIKFGWILSIVFSVLVPVLGFYMLEGYSQAALTDMAVQIQILNIILYALIFVFIAGISGNFARASVIAAMAEMFIGLANYYTVSFRYSPILPWDLLSVKTALSVTGNYTFTLPGKILMVVLLFVLLAVAGSKINLEIRGLGKRLALTVLGAVMLCLYSTGVQNVKVGAWFGLDDILFTPSVLYRNNGFMVAFTVNLQYLKIDKPDGYSGRQAETLAERYKAEASDFAAIAENSAGAGNTSENINTENINTENINTENLPNIIVVMNETFSDLADIADFETNQDYMPFIHSMENGEVENVVSGDLFVSVLGGNTANSEYEFLTGNSMSFLPPGSIAYQQYINDRIPGMAWTLRSLGCYETVGMHPYYASGWDRDEVYPFLGFEQALFKEQLTESDYFKNNYGYLRKYISDQAVTDLIIDEYQPENMGKERKFTFAVTMQNHGGYFDAYENFDQEIELTGVEAGNSKSYTDMYLSLIKKSDEAFENLVKYFENYEEPTIILMFGDHQPGDYVVRSVYDTNKERSLEEGQQRYVVPFVMWANYDIAEEHIDKISVNYLQTLLFEKAGVPLTGYQTYLSELRKKLPVITANVVIDAEGRYYAKAGDSPYADSLPAYEIFQYNYVFDSDARQNEFFGDYLQ